MALLRVMNETSNDYFKKLQSEKSSFPARLIVHKEHLTETNVVYLWIIIFFLVSLLFSILISISAHLLVMLKKHPLTLGSHICLHNL